MEKEDTAAIASPVGVGEETKDEDPTGGRFLFGFVRVGAVVCSSHVSKILFTPRLGPSEPARNL